MTLRTDDTSSAPSTPPSAIRIARVGGTIAEVAAAAISAQALYHLGGQLDLGPAAAWLLPAALDVYAFTALAVAYSLPAQHHAQKACLRTARLALAMTLSCNGLDHLLQKAGRLIDPTVRDLLLVGAATLPPIVVERLLKLQSLLVAQGKPAVGQGDQGDVLGEGDLAHPPEPDRPYSGSVDNLAELPSPTADRSEEGEPTEPDSSAGVTRADWTELGRVAFAELSDRLGRRPSGREFQGALAARSRRLVAACRLPVGTRPPSVSTAKRIRALLEAENSPHRIDL